MSIVTPFSLLCAALLAFSATTASADQGGSVGLIEVNAGLISVKLEKGALSDVLRAVGEQAGARVSIQGNLGTVPAARVLGRTPSRGCQILGAK